MNSGCIARCFVYCVRSHKYKWSLICNIPAQGLKDDLAMDMFEAVKCGLRLRDDNPYQQHRSRSNFQRA